MRLRSAAAGVLLASVLGSACGGDGTDSDGQAANTAAQLLASPVGDGVSTMITGDPDLVLDGPPVDLAELGFNRGDTSAVVKVVELSDFGCGFCRRFHEESFPTLRQQFIGSLTCRENGLVHGVIVQGT